MDTRVRINIKQTAKGLAQFDITAEAPTAEESAQKWSAAHDEYKKILIAKGLQSV